MPNRRPWTTWRLDVFREVRRKNSRSSGVGRGQFLYTRNWRAVRGCPSRRHAAICAWNAASKGGTSCWNSSSVTLVKSRNSVGRACTSVNRTLAIRDASLNQRHKYSINRDKLKQWTSPARLPNDKRREKRQAEDAERLEP